MNIVLIGIQGSGKGTLVASLTKEMEFEVISTGQLCRDEIATGSALGKHIKEVILKGNLVETDTVLKMIAKKLKSQKENYVFDGFPRSLEQAKAMKKVCDVDLAVYLNLSKEVAIERLVNRLTCSKCGNVFSKLKVKSDICPVCKGKLEQRFDDNLENKFKQFEVFFRDTLPLIDYYKKQNVLVEVDANQTPENVAKLVMRAINEHNYKK